MNIAREFKKDDKIKLFDMINEINNIDGNFEGLTNIRGIVSYDSFLEQAEKNKHQESIKPEYSPQTTFGVFDDNKLIGGFNLRHAITGALIHHGGNIGYLVRPSERKKGFGTIMLGLALEKARELGLDKVLISCREDNIGSAKVIENNGGIYENNYYDEQFNKTYKRYWIYLK